MIEQTAILYFTRNPSAELKSKNFCSTNAVLNKAVSNHLHKTTLTLLKQCGLPYFVIDENLQKGLTFGEKLANAFCDVYDAGFEHIIAVGNDCPQLNKKSIISAANELKNLKSVLGPTHDGGAYLIGISKNNFKKQAFIQLQWQTKNTYQQLFNLLIEAGADVFEDVILNDIDKEQDLFKLKDTSSPFKKIINNIIQLSLKYNSIYKIKSVNYAYSKSNILRGPPAFNI